MGEAWIVVCGAEVVVDVEWSEDLADSVCGPEGFGSDLCAEVLDVVGVEAGPVGDSTAVDLAVVASCADVFVL